MSYANEILTQVRLDAAPPDDALEEARRRRDAVLARATTFSGVRDSYVSGSIAHGTANEVKDADCGVILDRRIWPELGPDGDGVDPTGVVEEVRQHLRDSDLSEVYPSVWFRVDDRAIKIFFDEPMPDGHDPTVDLIVGLDRTGAPGLWIPKAMRSTNPTWDASHPQKHTDLFLPGDADLRRTRVWTTRYAKLVNDRFTNWSFSSFNLAALAYWGLPVPTVPDQALFDFYDFAAKDLSDHLTDDPAEVSGRIRLPNGITRKKAVDRITRHRNLAEQALEADTEAEAREALSKLFGPDHVTPPAGGAANLASGIRRGDTVKVGQAGVAVGAAAAGREVKPVRSYGDRRA